MVYGSSNDPILTNSKVTMGNCWEGVGGEVLVEGGGCCILGIGILFLDPVPILKTVTTYHQSDV